MYQQSHYNLDTGASAPNPNPPPQNQHQPQKHLTVKNVFIPADHYLPAFFSFNEQYSTLFQNFIRLQHWNQQYTASLSSRIQSLHALLDETETIRHQLNELRAILKTALELFEMEYDFLLRVIKYNSQYKTRLLGVSRLLDSHCSEQRAVTLIKSHLTSEVDGNRALLTEKLLTHFSDSKNFVLKQQQVSGQLHYQVSQSRLEYDHMLAGTTSNNHPSLATATIVADDVP